MAENKVKAASTASEGGAEKKKTTQSKATGEKKASTAKAAQDTATVKKPKAVKETAQATENPTKKPTATKSAPVSEEQSPKKPKAEPKPKETTTDIKPTKKPTATKSAEAAAVATAQAEVIEKVKTEDTPKQKPEVTVKSEEKPAKKAKPEKNETQTKKSASGKVRASGGSGSAAAAINKNKTKTIIIAACVAVLILTLVLGLVFGLKKNPDDPGNINNPGGGEMNGGDGNNGSGEIPEIPDFNPVTEINRYDSEFTTNTKVGYFGEVLGTTERVKPVAEVKNESELYGNKVYPTYGSNLNSVCGDSADRQAARTKLIQEASFLTTSNTWNGGGGKYTWMDKDGYLYNGTTANPQPVKYSDGTQRQLYKHTVADGLYGGSVSDDEPAIVKTVTLQPHGYTGYGVTGVYAPGGEVIKIEMSKADMEATGGLTIYIGQALYNGKANNIWMEKNQMQRFPIILNTLGVNKSTSYYNEETKTYTAYVGSFVGGPLYIKNVGSTFTVTISGGVRYKHFILGSTTKSEFEENAKSSAPYFDLEVWDCGVLHSGPRQYAEKFSYEDLYKVAVLWDKVANIATLNSWKEGIVFIYDPFVAAGAGVAFPRQMSVNCPLYWMQGSLDYNKLVSTFTDEAWGSFHEYHHNFQNFGVGSTGEVTNNALTLVAYSLFTKITQSRQLTNYGIGGIGGWAQYTCATWALNRVNNGHITDTNGLAVYSTLLHSFGQGAFVSAKTQWGSDYMNRYVDLTHQDFSYFAQMISKYDSNLTIKANDYPLFVPVFSVFQTGRSYEVNGIKHEIKTMQPYIIPYGSDFIVDLRRYTVENNKYKSGSIIIGNGFDFRIKSVNDSQADGTLTATDTEGVYVFTPGTKLQSGKIYVNLEITPQEGTNTYNKEIADVELILEFEQSHETNKTSLTRTTYAYDSLVYTDAQAAYEANFAGFSNKTTINHTNPVQNCNTDIWFYLDTEANRNKYPNAAEHYFMQDNTICVLEGKLYAPEESTYRIFLRGRLNCALYYSIDGGKTYKLGATIKDKDVSTATSGFRLDDENTYFDLNLNSGDWVYIKEVLINSNVDGNTASFIGVGMSKWVKPMFTMQYEYFDANGTKVDSPESEGYSYTVTHYFNYMGVEVSEEVVNSAQLTPPQSADYVNAYRTTYERVYSEFETDYFYVRQYTYSYSDDVWVNPITESGGQKVIYSNYKDNTFKLEFLTDGDRNSRIETWASASSFKNPDPMGKNGIQFVIDMGEEKAVNRMSLYAVPRGNGERNVAKSFTLEGSLDGNNFFPVTEVKDRGWTDYSFSVDFEEKTFRYYRLIVTDTLYNNGAGFQLSEIEMWHVTAVKGRWVAPDDEMLEYTDRGWHSAQADSTFGHIKVGNKDATIKFEFEGTQIGVLSSDAYGRNFEVYIDGEKTESIVLKEDSSATALVYACDKLTKGKHSVEIKCTDEANIDSIVICG